MVKDIKTSQRPRDMQFNADRSRLYVACGDDDVIEIVDVARLEVVGRLTTGPSPGRSPSTRSDDHRCQRSVEPVNHRHGAQCRRSGDPDRSRAGGGEDGKLYVTSEVGDLVHVIDADQGRITDDIVVGARPPVASTDGKELCGIGGNVGRGLYHRPGEIRRVGKIEFLPTGMRKYDVTPVGLVITGMERPRSSRSATPMWRWSTCQHAKCKATSW